MNISQLKEEIGILASALAEEKELDPALRIALAHYRDVKTWSIPLPSELDVQRTLADIWRVREELRRRADIVHAIAEGLRILRIFLPLPI